MLVLIFDIKILLSDDLKKKEKKRDIDPYLSQQIHKDVFFFRKSKNPFMLKYSNAFLQSK